MATIEEANAALEAVNAKLINIGGDVDTLIQAVKDLTDAANQGGVPDAVMEKINALVETATALDNKYPAQP